MLVIFIAAVDKLKMERDFKTLSDLILLFFIFPVSLKFTEVCENNVRDRHKDSVVIGSDVAQINQGFERDYKLTRRLPLSRRPTSRLLIESQTLTIWPGNDLDLGMTLTSFMTLTSDKSNQVKTDVQVAKLAFSMRWPWPWPNDLDTQTWPRYCQDVPP